MIELEQGMRNILHVLQENPRNYRCFGIWWWPVKALLRERFDQNNLFLLGDYVDEDALERLPKDLDPQEMLRRALQEYVPNDRYGVTSMHFADPDGNDYLLFDDDAGGV